MSVAAVSVSNMDIGPCQVFFDGDDLGGTLSNVVINFKYIKTKLSADQTGPETFLDEAISGIDVTVETEIAEVRNKTTLSRIFPTATLITSGAQKALQFNDKVATRQLQFAKNLKLHPLAEADAVEDYDWLFYKAVPTEESSYTFGAAEQGRLKIVWRIYLDLSTSPGRMFRIGDKDLA